LKRGLPPLFPLWRLALTQYFDPRIELTFKAMAHFQWPSNSARTLGKWLKQCWPLLNSTIA
jgi:hypothetical protein